MEEALSRSRGALVLRGGLCLAAGIATLAWPHLTLAILVLLFAVYAIGDGIFTIGWAATDERKSGQSWAAMLEGLLSLAAGLFFLFAPATASKLAFVGIGLWAVGTGVMQLVEAPMLQRAGASLSLLMVSGVLRLVLGAMLLSRPHAGLLALIWLVAVYAFAEGLLMLGLAFGGERRETLTPHAV